MSQTVEISLRIPSLRVRREDTDALETIRQDVQQKTSDEFLGGQRHRLLLAVMAIILIPECDLAVAAR